MRERERGEIWLQAAGWKIESCFLGTGRREQCSVAVLSSVCWPIRAEDDGQTGYEVIGSGQFSSKLFLYYDTYNIIMELLSE